MDETVNSLWETLLSWLDTGLFKSEDASITVGGILQVIAILIAAWMISKLLRNALKRYGSNANRMAPSSLYALDRVSHYCIILIGFFVAIASLGVDLTKFTLLISALGIGVGFGLQNIISNFVAGIMLMFEKTIKVSDFVELESGVTGEVKEINIRSTIITTNDNIDIVVPNSEFVDGRVTNWTMRDTYRRIHVPFGVAYGTDKEAVKEAVLAAADKVPHTLTGTSHRPPQVWLTEMDDSSLNFELVVWLKPEAVNRPGAVKAAFTWEIHSALEAADIIIPFPQRDLHIVSWPKEPLPMGSWADEQTAEEAQAETADQKKDDKPAQPSDNDAADSL